MHTTMVASKQNHTPKGNDRLGESVTTHKIPKSNH